MISNALVQQECKTQILVQINSGEQTRYEAITVSTLTELAEILNAYNLKKQEIKIITSREVVTYD